LRLSAGDPIKYHPDTLEYKVSVPYSIDTVTIFAKEGVFANTFSGAGFKRLNVGENTFEIVVTAESGIHTETYTVKVYRQSPDVTDATLKNLTLNSGAIPLKFQPSILKYRVEVEGEVSEIEIDCEANPGTTVSNAGVHTLDYGENVFTVTVKAEDFETQYTITVYRLRNDATLKYLVIAPVELTPPFDPDITQYTAKFPFSNTANVPYSVSSISMDFDVNDSLAELWTNPELERPGTKQLNVGENVFGIGVSAEDKRCYRAYWIRITREAPPVTTGLDEAGAPAAVQVYTANGRLYVNSPATEHINIYSVTGKLLYSFYKPAGAFTSPFTVHPSPVLIVKSSSGWSEKLVVSGY
ncbi:MAG: cadherin-like beta sandwich domain-containing protein, partial [Dysgonamonadaceae bacterium]|nr:cadherin-like beta sandwich domain-containing protein [Dysgonamonadaceae bacterium]